jgi:hypothetical protein
MAYKIDLLRSILFAISSDMLYICNVTKKRKRDNRVSKKHVRKWKPLYSFVLFSQTDSRHRFLAFFFKKRKRRRKKKNARE